MAQTNDNVILQKVSGNIGKQVVLKRVHGKTVLSKMPKKPAVRSAKQQMCAQGFKLASAYAKSVMLNPELKALYSAEAKRRGVINAYNMALSDCLRLPEIKEIDIANYTGKALGEVITIEVADTFKVVEVTVSIINDVTTIEEGSAIFVDSVWQYVTTALNAVATDSKVVVTAVDRAGNKIIRSILPF
jgi:hypothetical protein